MANSIGISAADVTQTKAGVVNEGQGEIEARSGYARTKRDPENVAGTLTQHPSRQ